MPGPTAVSITKGQDLFELAEQVRITPAPKLGGVAGPQIRFLSVSRDRSVVTDLELGSLAMLRRVTGLPLMHRLWSEPDGEGYSLGYTKRRRSGSPSELCFLDGSARLLATVTLPAAVSEVASAPGHWYVGCRDGALYAFSKDGRLAWRHAIPFQPRPTSILTSMMLDNSPQPYLFVGVAGLFAIVAESNHLFAIDGLGRRVWTAAIPLIDNESGVNAPGALPTKDELLHKLGFDVDDYQPDTMTGYLRLRLDTLLDSGLLKQVEVYDLKDDAAAEEGPAGIEIGVRMDTGGGPSDCRALACSPQGITVGTAEGKVHVFDTNATWLKAFQVGDAPVSRVAVDNSGVRAAHAGGLLALFRGGRMTGSLRLPEYFVDLTVCGDAVLAWRWNSAWLIEETGRVAWAATTERRIGSAMAEAGGFQLLAGRFASLRPVGRTQWRGASRGLR